MTEYLPADIKHHIEQLNNQWKAIRLAPNSTSHAEIESHHRNIIAAKNALINCLTKEYL